MLAGDDYAPYFAPQGTAVAVPQTYPTGYYGEGAWGVDRTGAPGNAFGTGAESATLAQWAYYQQHMQQQLQFQGQHEAVVQQPFAYAAWPQYGAPMNDPAAISAMQAPQPTAPVASRLSKRRAEDDDSDTYNQPRRKRFAPDLVARRLHRLRIEHEDDPEYDSLHQRKMRILSDAFECESVSDGAETVTMLDGDASTTDGSSSEEEDMGMEGDERLRFLARMSLNKLEPIIPPSLLRQSQPDNSMALVVYQSPKEFIEKTVLKLQKDETDETQAESNAGDEFAMDHTAPSLPNSPQDDFYYSDAMMEM